ncbi:hypothetical protein MMC17_000815 [Xylographa soralifera]|nr:hypothetical protein [Xylographa soralifera]
MSLLRRMSQLGSKLSGSRRRSNTSQVSNAPHESKDRRTTSTSQASGFSSPFTSRKRSQTTVPAKKQSTTIDESDIVLHLLRMDVAMHSYFCFHKNPNFQYSGSWVNKTLQQLLTHVPILYPKDPSAYQDWIVSSAIDFIEQHNANIKRLTNVVRRVHAEDQIDETKNYTLPISRSMNSDVARLTELVRKLEPRLGQPKDKAELFELTNICISSLKQQLVALDEEWDFHKNPWGGDEKGSIEDMWDYVHSSHGRTIFTNKELASVVELIYRNHAKIEAQPLQEDSDEQLEPGPNPGPIEKDGYLIPPNRQRRRHLHTEPSSDAESSTHSRKEQRSRSGTERALQKEKEQEEYLERLKRHRARREKEEAEHSRAKGQGQEQEYYDYRQQRRLRKEESEQEYLSHLQRNRLRRERKDQKRRGSGPTPREEYQMSGGL